MNECIIIDNVTILIERKNIKNMYIRITSPKGDVKMSVPYFMDEKRIKDFLESKIDWIKKHKNKIENSSKKIENNYVSGETHYLWGKPYTLDIQYVIGKEAIFIQDDKIILRVHEDVTSEYIKAFLDEYYRMELKKAVPKVLSKCEDIVCKHVNEWRIKNMKTRWGTCNIQKKRIWLNLQLAKKLPECLEYVITHELVHLYVRNHNNEFKAYMDKFYPNWRKVNKLLNI